MSRFRQGALLVLLTVVAYLPALRAGFVWDDDLYVTANPTLRTVAGLRDIWLKPGATPQYYPLTFTTLWIQYHLSGTTPSSYHLLNILLHALNAVLLWMVLRRLEIAGAWWVAAIFAVHPVQVESVAWITERKNVLSGAFYMLTLLAYLRYRGERDWRWYPLVLALFAGALLSKTVACSLPAVLVLLIWWKEGRVVKREAWTLAPMFVLGAAAGWMTSWVERQLAGAQGLDWNFSFVDRCLIAGRAFWFYAAKLVWPHNLTFIYPRWEINSGIWWQYLFPVTALGVLIGLWAARRRIGRGPLVAVLFFAGTLAPALGFVDVYPFLYSFVADHFQYLACVGLIALVVSGIKHLRVFVLVIVGLGVLTWNQTQIYRNIETLWRDTLAKNPNAWMAHHNLGGLLANRGQTQEAIEQYTEALRVNPNLAETHHNLGEALFSEGATGPAIAEYHAALRLDPSLAETHHKLGVALASEGKIPEAIDEYVAALQIDHGLAQTHVDLGNAFLQQRQLTDAVAAYRSALLFAPQNAEAHHNLGAALSHLGKTEEAVAEYKATLRLNPKFAAAHHNLGLALASQGKTAEAIASFSAALAINPDAPETHHNLGLTLANEGKMAEAIAEYTAALRLRPDYLEATYDLAEALASLGKIEEAIAVHHRALKIATETGEIEFAKVIQERLKVYQRSASDSR